MKKTPPTPIVKGKNRVIKGWIHPIYLKTWKKIEVASIFTEKPNSNMYLEVAIHLPPQKTKDTK